MSLICYVIVQNALGLGTVLNIINIKYLLSYTNYVSSILLIFNFKFNLTPNSNRKINHLKTSS